MTTLDTADVGRSLRLAVGTLTAIRVPPIDVVTPRVATGAMLLAPVAVLPLALFVGVVVWAGGQASLPPLATAFIAIGGLALGSRALHLDGLADVADGLTASYSRERSLAVMKGGTVGPAGVVALIVVLGLQVAGLTQLAALAAVTGELRYPLLAGGTVCVSRAALWIVCAKPVPPARRDGLGVSFAGSVPVIALLGWLALEVLTMLIHPIRGPIVVAAAAFAVVWLVWRAVKRFGGVTGDVYGAAIEVCLAVLLVGFAVPV